MRYILIHYETGHVVLQHDPSKGDMRYYYHLEDGIKRTVTA